MGGGAEPIATAADAERMLGDLSTTMAELSALLEEETALIGAGRVREGLSTESRKAELGHSYISQLREAKDQVIALTRLAPDGLRAFRAAQAEFERVLSRNQTVIATARAVSEGLIKALAEEMDRKSRPVLYGAGPKLVPATAAAARAGPIVISRHL